MARARARHRAGGPLARHRAADDRRCLARGLNAPPHRRPHGLPDPLGQDRFSKTDDAILADWECAVLGPASRDNLWPIGYCWKRDWVARCPPTPARCGRLSRFGRLARAKEPPPPPMKPG